MAVAGLRPSDPTLRAPAARKPGGPGEFGPNPSVFGLAVAPPRPSTLTRIPSGRTIEPGLISL
jgi:hypothetical protein